MAHQAHYQYGHHGPPPGAPRRPAKGYHPSKPKNRPRANWPQRFVPQGIGLCAWVIVGSWAGKDFYIVQVRSIRTDVSISFRLGYLASGSQVNASACIARTDYHDDMKDSFAMQYLNRLGLGSQQATLSAFPSAPSPTASNIPQAVKNNAKDQLLVLAPVIASMQSRVFPAIPSILFLSIFGSTSLILLVMTATSFKSNTAKIFLITTAILNGYSQTLGWMIAYGSWQACRALLVQTQGSTTSKNSSKEAVLIIGSSSDGLDDSEVFFVSDNQQLQIVQWIIVTLTCVVQVMIAVLFIKRRAAAKAKAKAGPRAMYQA
ncbi:hypothetical protein Micbo1qcDRAFT_221812 [Microdochium bolleyi]|uniref:Uncharacterized protein n=1 Tax=Microdochium bolleyi TaxID=196109 RepID=A0A136IL02_9PEZI|nr:hypothetical protein Micbo1qcDRAFT_221812 [Microdochium bolleyi]